MTEIQIEMPDDVAAEFFRRAPDPGGRVRLLETIFREYFRKHEHEASELALLNANADELNAEAEDVLSYQVYLETG
jgi:hypothetical protein